MFKLIFVHFNGSNNAHSILASCAKMGDSFRWIQKYSSVDGSCIHFARSTEAHLFQHLFIHFFVISFISPFFTPLQELQGTSWWSEFALERLLLGLAEEVKKHRLCDFNLAFFHSKKRYCTKPRRPLISEEDKRKLWKLVSFECKNLTNFLFQV